MKQPQPRQEEDGQAALRAPQETLPQHLPRRRRWLRLGLGCRAHVRLCWSQVEKALSQAEHTCGQPCPVLGVR